MGIPLNGLPPILEAAPDQASTEGGNLMASGGMDPISGMVMDFAFPIVKPIIEEQVRRVTVSVFWKRAARSRPSTWCSSWSNELPFLPPTSGEDDVAPGTPGAPATTPQPTPTPTPLPRRPAK